MTPEQVKRAVAATGLAVEHQLTALGEDFAGWHPAGGEWCAKEVVVHLTGSERHGFAGRIGEMLAAENPRLRPTPPVAPGYCERPLAEVLAEFRDQRQASLLVLERLTSADLGKGGVHDRVGDLTIADILQEWVHHDAEHHRQILVNVMAFVWPDLGGAQRFSG